MIDHKPDQASAVVPKTRTDHSGVSLHIERLVLDGIPLGPGQAQQLQAALEKQLTQLISMNGLDRGMIAGGARPFIGTRGIELSSAMNPRRLGGQIAQAVYSGLKI